MAVTQSTRLGCGRDIDDLWSTIEQAPSAHESTCPYCQGARTDLAALAAATKDMTGADNDNPRLRLTGQVMTDILAIARTEVRRGRTLPLRRTHAGLDGSSTIELTVSEQAVATVVRQACDQVPGVEGRRCSIQAASSPQGDAAPHRPLDPADDVLDDRPADGVRGDGTPAAEPAEVTIDLGISVTHTAAIPALTALLRHQILAAVSNQVGITVSRIDIHVEDLHDA